MDFKGATVEFIKMKNIRSFEVNECFDNLAWDLQKSILQCSYSGDMSCYRLTNVENGVKTRKIQYSEKKKKKRVNEEHSSELISTESKVSQFLNQIRWGIGAIPNCNWAIPELIFYVYSFHSFLSLFLEQDNNESSNLTMTTMFSFTYKGVLWGNALPLYLRNLFHNSSGKRKLYLFCELTVILNDIIF